MQTVLITTLIFLSQIILISWYLPRKLVTRERLLLERFPQSNYPRLYPQEEGLYRRRLKRFLAMAYASMVIGLLVLSWLVLTDGLLERSNILYFAVYMFIQVLPLSYHGAYGFKTLSLMRKDRAFSVRRAGLNPRKFSKFVTLKATAVLLIVYVIYCVLTLVLFDFEMGFGTLAANRIYVVIFVFLFSAVQMLVLVRIKKLDPHLSDKDWAARLSMSAKLMYFIGYAVMGFLLLDSFVIAMDLHSYRPALTSVYLQLIAASGYVGQFLLKIEDMDFEVYRESPGLAN